MTVLNLAARLVAAAAHEVITEYRKLDAPEDASAEPGETELSCTAVTTELTSAPWDHDTRPRVVAARSDRQPFGFGR